MTSITHRGNTVPLNGEMPKAGEKAPDVTLVTSAMKEMRLSELQSPIKVLLCMPSLDTSTCAAETRRFNEELAGMDDVEAVVITKDLPFAMRRFCETEGISNITSASDFRYNEFSARYGVEITEGNLKGLHARAVLVLDENNIIKYTELVPEVSEEPDYKRTLDIVRSLLKERL